jgi:anti-sigma factor RsiW
MNCARVRKLLDEYRDGELGEASGSACDGHLRLCACCSEALKEREEASVALRGWEKAEVSDDLTARVVSAWETRWPKEQRLARRRTVAARAGVVVVAAAAAVLVGFTGVRAMSAVRKLSATPSNSGAYGPWEQVPGLDISQAERHRIGG